MSNFFTLFKNVYLLLLKVIGLNFVYTYWFICTRKKQNIVSFNCHSDGNMGVTMDKKMGHIIFSKLLDTREDE